MPPRDPNVPQLDFPQLVADLIQQLRLIGPVGLLDFVPSVSPVYLAAVRDGVGFTITPPAFDSAETFSNVSGLGPVVGSVHATTGPLPAGTYDVMAGFSQFGFAGNSGVELQHRNAADAANLAAWPNLQGAAGTTTNRSFPFVAALNIGLNERLRFALTVANAGGAAQLATWIMAAIRPAP